MNTFIPKLLFNGIILIVDVSTYNNVSQEWLPKMMDAGITQTDCSVIMRNDGYNQIFTVSHQKRQNDISKIGWRIAEKCKRKHEWIIKEGFIDTACPNPLLYKKN